MQPQAFGYVMLVAPVFIVLGAMQFSQGKPFTGAALVGLGLILSGFGYWRM